MTKEEFTEALGAEERVPVPASVVRAGPYAVLLWLQINGYQRHGH